MRDGRANQPRGLFTQLAHTTLGEARFHVASDRYSRQILFPPIGSEGQDRLSRASAVIVGCGALGTAQAGLLARAGIGELKIVDRDFVEESNLQRQTLFDEADAAARLPKAVAAERKLKLINSSVKVGGIVADVQPDNAEELLSGYKLILDGTDNFETRFLLNDAAVKLGVPWIYGAVVGSYGVTMTVLPGRTACLACIMEESPGGLQETCDTVGVIGPAANWVTAIQSSEALKLLCGREEDLHGKLLSCDIWYNRYQQIEPVRNPACPACVAREFRYLEGERQAYVSMCGRGSVQIRQRQPRQIDLEALKSRLASCGAVRSNGFLVQCAIDPYELTVFQDGRAMIKGTQDPAVARSIYARYVGS